MKTERKRDLQALGVWVIIMAGVYFFHGFPDIAWFIGSAWVCFIVSGVLVLIWESNFKTEEKREISLEERKRIDLSYAYSRGIELTRKRKYEEALSELDMAIKGGVGAVRYNFRALCLQALDFHDEAIEDFDRAISLEPKDCNLYFCRGMSKRDTGDFDGCIADIKTAIRLSELGSKVNDDYKKHAKEMGWPDGHTSFYEFQLLSTESMKNMDKELRQSLMKKNKKRRNSTIP